MPTYDGILLATKRVQEQFTTTRSTVKLDSHGLLPEEGDNRRDTRREPNLSHSRHATQNRSGSSPQQEPPTPRYIVDLSRLEGLDGQSLTVRRPTPSHTSGSSLDLSGTTAFVSSASTSQSVSSTASIMTSSESSSISERQLTPHDEGEEDSDSEYVNPYVGQGHGYSIPASAPPSHSHFELAPTPPPPSLVPPQYQRHQTGQMQGQPSLSVSVSLPFGNGFDSNGHPSS